jgi:hypothetical protein
VKLDGYKVELVIDPELGFSITDNCGGISLDDAANYAFTFGRKESQKGEEGSIGVYGIGMKRAVFKIGNQVKIVSSYKEDDSYCVSINVPEWLKGEDRNWDFNLEPTTDLDEHGVRIEVTDLHKDIHSSFSDPAFLKQLTSTIARDYSFLIANGLQITLNSRKIKGWQIELLESETFVPIRKELKVVDDSQNMTSPISIELLAGMAAPPPETNDPTEDDFLDDRYGWYIVCNGRVVLAANKSEATGWASNGFQKWHPQYNGFIGFVVFDGNAADLPLTTTKRNVDTSSNIYKRTLVDMREIAKSWVEYTNTRKNNIPKARDEEKTAKPSFISSIKSSPQISFPAFEKEPKVKMANISYAKTAKDVKHLADAIGKPNMSYKDIGIFTFDYTFSDFVGEDD